MADRNTKFYDGVLASYPVGAGETIELGKLTFLGSDGYATQVVADAATFIGVADETVTNSTATEGYNKVRVRRTGVFEFTTSGLAVDDVGAALYLGASTGAVAASGTIIVGKLAWFDTATNAPVDITSAVIGQASA